MQVSAGEATTVTTTVANGGHQSSPARMLAEEQLDHVLEGTTAGAARLAGRGRTPRSHVCPPPTTARPCASSRSHRATARSVRAQPAFIEGRRADRGPRPAPRLPARRQSTAGHGVGAERSRFPSWWRCRTAWSRIRHHRDATTCSASVGRPLRFGPRLMVLRRIDRPRACAIVLPSTRTWGRRPRRGRRRAVPSGWAVGAAASVVVAPVRPRYESAASLRLLNCATQRVLVLSRNNTANSVARSVTCTGLKPKTRRLFTVQHLTQWRMLERRCETRDRSERGHLETAMKEMTGL